MTTKGSELMSNCTSGCKTQDHQSYAQCLQAKSLRVAYCNSANGFDYTQQKAWDRDLAAYKDARAQGIQPSSTDRAAVNRAVAISNESGKAWDAS
jgi:hypothetical protein